MRLLRFRGWVAQLVEQRIENPRVSGSIPFPATKIALDPAAATAGSFFIQQNF